MSIYENPAEALDAPEATTVAVFGLGKMGLPLAAVLADCGMQVRGVDIDPEIVSSVESGECPHENEPGLPDLLDEYSGDRLTATTDGATAAEAADIHVLLVPTVVDAEHEPVLEPLLSAANDIASGIDAGDLVIVESTVPPGTTTETISSAVTPDDGDIDAGEDFGLAYCPERTYAGRVIQDLTESYPKIVGGIDEESTAAAATLYRQFNEPGVIEMGSATAAEAVKVFEGVYRDTNIALANELAKACEEWGIDSATVFEAANTQPFCDLHTPGIGVGGHCIPVYPHFVTGRATDTPLVETARRVNDSMPDHAVKMLETLLDGHGRVLTDASILVLGVTYRPGVRETRFAPALDVVDRLQEEGATPYAHDPLLTVDELEESGAIGVGDPLSVPELDGIVLATAHEGYSAIDLESLADSMRTPVVVDGRRFFDPDEMDAFTYAAIGNGERSATAERRASVR